MDSLAEHVSRRASVFHAALRRRYPTVVSARTTATLAARNQAIHTTAHAELNAILKAARASTDTTWITQLRALNRKYGPPAAASSPRGTAPSPSTSPASSTPGLPQEYT